MKRSPVGRRQIRTLSSSPDRGEVTLCDGETSFELANHGELPTLASQRSYIRAVPHAGDSGPRQVPPGRRPARAPAAAYRGAPINWDRFTDGPDALPHRIVLPPPQTSSTSTAHELAVKVAELLERVEVDAVRVEYRASDESRRVLVDMRLEYVGEKLIAMPWVSVLVRGDLLLAELARANVPADSVLLPSWTLPFAAPDIPVSSPCVLVWRAKRTAIECGSIVADVLLATLAANPDRIRVAAIECSLAETRRRHNLLSFKRTLQGKTRVQRHLEVLNHCVKCGQPLRDPASARLGIGPECRKSYSAEQLWVAENRTRDIRLNVKPPAAWLTAISKHWDLPTGELPSISGTG